MSSKPYIALWLLLSLALAIITFVAFYDDISIGDYTLKKAPINEMLFAEAEADSLTVSPDSLQKLEEKAKTDSLPQSIFIFGDSMTYNLALRLAQYAKQNGHTIHSVNWDSSNTKIWADYDTLAYYINKYHPSQIFISLGSNELYLPKPEIRKPHVQKILEVIDTIPYVWIGPPNWAEDTGFNDMVASMCRPGTFFKSAGMEFKRKPDKIHPTREASALWVDSIMRWLPKSAHPFMAELPADSVGKCNPNIVFLKALNK